MRVARKLTLAVIAGVVAVHAVSALVRIRRERNLFLDDVARDERTLGRTLAHAAVRAWQIGGEPEVLNLVGQVNDRESGVSIRWVRPGAAAGTPDAPAVGPEALRALAAGEPVLLRHGAGSGALYSYTPLALPGADLSAIEVSDPLLDEDAYLYRSLHNTLIGTGTLVALCAALTWGLGFVLIGRPVRLLVEQARRIGRGELDRRIAPRGADEMAELAREMDHMCDGLAEARDRIEAETRTRVAAMDQLRHADRLTTVGKLASGVAHELGTPINVISGHAALTRADPEAGAGAIDNAAVISRQCERMTQIIRQLLDFSRRGGVVGASCDLHAVARDTLGLVEPMARKADVVTELEVDEENTMAGVPFGHAQQVLTNIVMNGIQAMPGGGRLAIRLTVERAAPPDGDGREDDYVCMHVEDTGPGMDEAIVRQVFEPFFTTKDVGEGTGLGLSVAHGIVRDYGGWIDVASEPGRGSRFSVHLPAPAAS